MNDDSRMTDAENDAAHWYARLNRDDPSEEEWDKFEAWRAADPAHAAAYAAISLIWEEVGALEQEAFPAVTNSLEPSPLKGGSMVSRARRFVISVLDHRVGKIAAFATSAAASLALSWLGALYSGVFDQTYETEIAGRRAVETKDGSHIELNTNTMITIAYRLRTRRVQLVRGQAYFDVANNNNRPFVVQTDASIIKVVGTRFEVDVSEQNKISVTVAEGRVAVSPSSQAVNGRESSSDAGITVNAGMRYDQSLSSNDHVLSSVDVETALAWRRNQLVFHNVRFGDAVNALSRYVPAQLSVRDQALADMAFSGVIQLGDNSDIVLSLETISGARAVRLGDNEILFQPAAE